MKHILLLCSYCGDDDPSCTNAVPCLDCLQMCNIVSVAKYPKAASTEANLGGWDYNRDLVATGLPREAAIAEVAGRAVKALLP